MIAGDLAIIEISDSGSLALADFGHIGAAGVEGAARWWSNG